MQKFIFNCEVEQRTVKQGVIAESLGEAVVILVDYFKLPVKILNVKVKDIFTK